MSMGTKSPALISNIVTCLPLACAFTESQYVWAVTSYVYDGQMVEEVLSGTATSEHTKSGGMVQ